MIDTEPLAAPVNGRTAYLFVGRRGAPGSPPGIRLLRFYPLSDGDKFRTFRKECPGLAREWRWSLRRLTAAEWQAVQDGHELPAE